MNSQKFPNPRTEIELLCSKAHTGTKWSNLRYEWIPGLYYIWPTRFSNNNTVVSDEPKCQSWFSIQTNKEQKKINSNNDPRILNTITFNKYWIKCSLLKSEWTIFCFGKWEITEIVFNCHIYCKRETWLWWKKIRVESHYHHHLCLFELIIISCFYRIFSFSITCYVVVVVVVTCFFSLIRW